MDGGWHKCKVFLFVLRLVWFGFFGRNELNMDGMDGRNRWMVGVSDFLRIYGILHGVSPGCFSWGGSRITGWIVRWVRWMICGRFPFGEFVYRRLERSIFPYSSTCRGEVTPGEPIKIPLSHSWIITWTFKEDSRWRVSFWECAIFWWKSDKRACSITNVIVFPFIIPCFPSLRIIGPSNGRVWTSIAGVGSSISCQFWGVRILIGLLHKNYHPNPGDSRPKLHPSTLEVSASQPLSLGVTSVALLQATSCGTPTFWFQRKSGGRDEKIHHPIRNDGPPNKSW